MSVISENLRITPKNTLAQQMMAVELDDEMASSWWDSLRTPHKLDSAADGEEILTTIFWKELDDCIDTFPSTSAPEKPLSKFFFSQKVEEYPSKYLV